MPTKATARIDIRVTGTPPRRQLGHLQDKPRDQKRSHEEPDADERVGPVDARHAPGHARPRERREGGGDAAHCSPGNACAIPAASNVSGTRRPTAISHAGLCPGRPEAQCHDGHEDADDKDGWTATKRTCDHVGHCGIAISPLHRGQPRYGGLQNRGSPRCGEGGSRHTIASSALEGGNDESPNTMADRASPSPPRWRRLWQRDHSGPATSADPAARPAASPARSRSRSPTRSRPDKPSNLPLAEFKRQVETLSGGSMTRDDPAPEPSTTSIRRAPTGRSSTRSRAGAFQMAVVPARAWSAAGVTSLKALQAPFLFESDEHVAAVVDELRSRQDLLGGFEGSGVTGLTLFPESLRHLFSFGEPMLTPADVKGRTIRAISSHRDDGDHRGPRWHGRRPGRRCLPAGRRRRHDPRHRQRLHARWR